MLTAKATANFTDFHKKFSQAEPFQHLVIDQFFEEKFANSLLNQFPVFNQSKAYNENGEIAGKAVVEKIRSLGTSYAQLDNIIKGKPFLSWLSAVTGIKDLLYDPYYFGGGTHENLHGQSLDLHVDFNRHPTTRYYRRLNLIVYLNKGWNPSWGGNLELHSDPRASDDQVLSISPEFNRCVIFETTDSSWHGFPSIQLPDSQIKTLSRKSIALYFYTREQPGEADLATHSTVYVDRPLPSRLVPGHILTEEDLAELQILTKRRDQHIERLYKDQTHLMTLLEQTTSALRQRNPVIYLLLKRVPALGRLAKKIFA